MSDKIGSDHGYVVITPPSKRARAEIDEVIETSPLGQSTLDSNERDCLTISSYLEEKRNLITPPPTKDFEGLQESPLIDYDGKVIPYYIAPTIEFGQTSTAVNSDGNKFNLFCIMTEFTHNQLSGGYNIFVHTTITNANSNGAIHFTPSLLLSRARRYKMAWIRRGTVLQSPNLLSRNP